MHQPHPYGVAYCAHLQYVGNSVIFRHCAVAVRWFVAQLNLLSWFWISVFVWILNFQKKVCRYFGQNTVSWWRSYFTFSAEWCWNICKGISCGCEKALNQIVICHSVKEEEADVLWTNSLLVIRWYFNCDIILVLYILIARERNSQFQHKHLIELNNFSPFIVW